MFQGISQGFLGSLLFHAISDAQSVVIQRKARQNVVVTSMNLGEIGGISVRTVDMLITLQTI